MITFRRALIVAAVILGIFFVIRSTHSSSGIVRRVRNSPKPTGSYFDNKAIQIGSPPNQGPATSVAVPKPTHSAEPEKPWRGDNGGRVSLPKKPVAQIALSDLKAQPLRKQLEYTFPYDPEGKFPAYVWQTWKHNPSQGEFEEEYRAPEASWSELHPNFVHEVVTDDIAVHLIRHFYASIPEVEQAYSALPEPVLRADFFRYLILLARGGIYSDIDTTALKSAVDWVPAQVPRSAYGLVIGIEADPDRDDWRDWYSRRIQFCQWTIQAKAGHPVLVDIVASITEETLRLKSLGELKKNKMKSIVEFTGPAIWTDAIFRFFNNPEYFDMTTSKEPITWKQFTGIRQAKKVGDVIVLPITSFSPGVGQMGAGEEDDPMAFVKHQFSGTWKPESERYIGM